MPSPLETSIARLARQRAAGAELKAAIAALNDELATLPDKKLFPVLSKRIRALAEQVKEAVRK